jgi:hypothetical protein
MPPFGKGPDQQKLHNRGISLYLNYLSYCNCCIYLYLGNSYIRNEFPLIDFIEQCELVEKKVQYIKEEEEGSNSNIDL